MSQERHEGGRGLRDQIERYRTSFIAIVAMVVFAAFTGGYVLSHERLTLPGWFPVIGHESFHLKAEFSTAQALTPGQGQSITIAGAKVGEIEAVELHQGRATVSMELEPRYAKHIYRNATMLMRPKTPLKDMTIQVDPGSPSAGPVRRGETIPLAQTAPDVNFEQFLDSLDGETRSYLKALLAAAGGALNGNGRALSQDFRRFDPITRDLERISKYLEARHKDIAQSIHNFQLIMTAIGGRDKQLSQVIEASNKDFAVFSEEDQAVQRTLQLLPGALAKTGHGLGKLATAAQIVGPTLKKLKGFANSLAPGQEASRTLFKNSTPIIRDQISPFASEVQSVLRRITPATKSFDQALPSLTSSFKVINEFFNELAYNPGAKQGGFLFFLDWANHDFNSALSTADANGPLGRTVLFFNCEIASLLKSVAEINPNVNLLVGLLKPPEGQECIEHHLKVIGEAPPAAGAAGTTAPGAGTPARAASTTAPGAGSGGKG